jgi:hypothetical protein
MTVSAFANKSNAVRCVLNRKLHKRELSRYSMRINADDRRLEILMQDIKGNLLTYDIKFALCGSRAK